MNFFAAFMAFALLASPALAARVDVPSLPEAAYADTEASTNIPLRVNAAAHPIKENNFWFVDAAGEDSVESNWIPNSEMVWKIPIGWHRRTDFDSDDWFDVFHPDYEVFGYDLSRSLIVGNLYHQRFTIDAKGIFRIEKYGHWISRSPSCLVILDGNVLQEEHQP